MKAHATVVAERDSRAMTRCTTLRSSPPISLRPTTEGLHLVASAAGPIGGDDVCIDITVADAAALTIRTIAAQVALPGPHTGPSLAAVTATVGEGAHLVWLPEPLVLAVGADHRATISVALASTASLVWREEIVLGRHDEPSGSLLQRLRVDRGGRPLLRNDLALGPAWPGADGPAGSDGARVVGTVLVVGPAARWIDVPARADVRFAVCPLAHNAVLVTALGRSREALGQVLDAAVGATPPPVDSPGDSETGRFMRSSRPRLVRG